MPYLGVDRAAEIHAWYTSHPEQAGYLPPASKAANDPQFNNVLGYWLSLVANKSGGLSDGEADALRRYGFAEHLTPKSNPRGEFRWELENAVPRNSDFVRSQQINSIAATARRGPDVRGVNPGPALPGPKDLFPDLFPQVPGQGQEQGHLPQGSGISGPAR
ncbi:hypothetical protein AB0E04_47050 [Streptomyces sp. NPDC048251]|uniref:hypothetical protein n=1 Tax=Streptomyces sp. NPDC048251 TaxID=3154501 RepID=UPI0034193605